MDVDCDALLDAVHAVAHDWQGFEFGRWAKRRIAATWAADAVVAGAIRMHAGDE